MTAIPTTPFSVELTNINKRFGQVWANQDIDLAVPTASVHGLIGENGAGKSTLMSVLYGFYQADSGSIKILGQTANIKNSTQAIQLGIGMVHQHFMLVDTLSVLENILLGAEDSWNLEQSKQRARVKLKAISDRFGLDVPLDERVGDLPVGIQQRVEILKALYREAKILILDEPTGVLTPQEADQLFEVIKDLKSQGVTVMIITHKLREIMHVTDHVSVMRQGKMVAHRKTSETNAAELAELMVGRPVAKYFEKGLSPDQSTKLTVQNLSFVDSRGVKKLDDISFELRAGEILGVAGVSGGGQTELLKILSGEMKGSSGQMELRLSGSKVFNVKTWPDPKELRALKIAHIPEDRLGQGVLKNFTMQESSILGYHRDNWFGRFSMSLPKIKNWVDDLIKSFDVRPNLPSIRTANMSGGNQQKLIIAREMKNNPQILLIGQPTRGVDIGAIELIYKEIIKARDAGCAILLVSVELDEILTLADRIIVMNQGRITGEMPAKNADPRDIGLMMASTNAMTTA